MYFIRLRKRSLLLPFFLFVSLFSTFLSRSTYRPLLVKIITDTQSLVETVAKDAGEYKNMHPVFGWLNAHEWFHNLDMHHRHHLRQQGELETAVK